MPNPHGKADPAGDPRPRGGSLGRLFATGMVIGVITRLALIGTHVVLARTLGPLSYGTFSFALGVGTVVAQVAPMGWQTGVTRFIHQYLAEEASGLLRGVVRRAAQVSIGTSLVAGAGMIGVAQSGMLRQQLAAGLVLGGLLVPGLAIRRFVRRCLLGVSMPRLGMLLDEGAVPAFLGSVVILGFVGSVEQAVFVCVCVSLLGATACWPVFTRKIPAAARMVTPQFRGREWAAVGMTIVVGSSSRIIMERLDVLMIGPMVGIYETGLYSAAARLALTVSFAGAVIGSVCGPAIADAYFKGNRTRVRRTFRASMLISAAGAVVLGAGMLIWAKPIMVAAFGPEFAASADALRILAIGQIFQAGTGPTVAALIMTGHERAFGVTTGIAMTINVVGTFIGIRYFGIVGAAAAAAASLVLLNCLQLAVVWRRVLCGRPPGDRYSEVT